MAISAGALWTDITIEGVKTKLTEQVLSASVAVPLSPRLTLVTGAGGLLGGGVGDAGFGGGALAFLGASYRALAPDGAVPLVSVGVTAAAAYARAAGDSLTSTDLKLAISAAWPIAGVFAPYLAGAVFGGPIFYRGGIRGDRYHYQAIAGATVVLPGGFASSSRARQSGRARCRAASALPIDIQILSQRYEVDWRRCRRYRGQLQLRDSSCHVLPPMRNVARRLASFH